MEYPFRDKVICCYCGEAIAPAFRTTEHIIPWSKGGANTRLNKRDCCYNCNNERGDKPITIWSAEYREKIIKYPDSPFRTRWEAIVKNCDYLLRFIEVSGSRLYRSEDLYKQRDPIR